MDLKISHIKLINSQLCVYIVKRDGWLMCSRSGVCMVRLLLSLCSLPGLRVFVHLPISDTGFGTIFTSDDRGIIYSKSLDRHLYTTTGGETDFTNVTSLRGVYITSVLSEGELVTAVLQPNMSAVEDLGETDGPVPLLMLLTQPIAYPCKFWLFK